MTRPREYLLGAAATLLAAAIVGVSLIAIALGLIAMLLFIALFTAFLGACKAIEIAVAWAFNRVYER